MSEKAGDKTDNELHAVCFGVSALGTGHYSKAQIGNYKPESVIRLEAMEKSWILY